MSSAKRVKKEPEAAAKEPVSATVVKSRRQSNIVEFSPNRCFFCISRYWESHPGFCESCFRSSQCKSGTPPDELKWAFKYLLIVSKKLMAEELVVDPETGRISLKKDMQHKRIVYGKVSSSQQFDMVVVILYDAAKNVIDQLRTDNHGVFCFLIDLPEDRWPVELRAYDGKADGDRLYKALDYKDEMIVTHRVSLRPQLLLYAPLQLPEPDVSVSALHARIKKLVAASTTLEVVCNEDFEQLVDVMDTLKRMANYQDVALTVVPSFGASSALFVGCLPFVQIQRPLDCSGNSYGGSSALAWYEPFTPSPSSCNNSQSQSYSQSYNQSQSTNTSLSSASSGLGSANVSLNNSLDTAAATTASSSPAAVGATATSAEYSICSALNDLGFLDEGEEDEEEGSSTAKLAVSTPPSAAPVPAPVPVGVSPSDLRACDAENGAYDSDDEDDGTNEADSSDSEGEEEEADHSTTSANLVAADLAAGAAAAADFDREEEEEEEECSCYHSQKRTPVISSQGVMQVRETQDLVNIYAEQLMTRLRSQCLNELLCRVPGGSSFNLRITKSVGGQNLTLATLRQANLHLQVWVNRACYVYVFQREGADYVELVHGEAHMPTGATNCSPEVPYTIVISDSLRSGAAMSPAGHNLTFYAFAFDRPLERLSKHLLDGFSQEEDRFMKARAGTLKDVPMPSERDFAALEMTLRA